MKLKKEVKTVSQRGEKYSRALGHNMKILWWGLAIQGLRVKSMEDKILHLQSVLEQTRHKEKEDTKLHNAVSLLIHEQRRRKISQQRILFLIKMAAICALLIWLSFQILIS